MRFIAAFLNTSSMILEMYKNKYERGKVCHEASIWIMVNEDEAINNTVF